MSASTSSSIGETNEAYDGDSRSLATMVDTLVILALPVESKFLSDTAKLEW